MFSYIPPTYCVSGCLEPDVEEKILDKFFLAIDFPHFGLTSAVGLLFMKGLMSTVEFPLSGGKHLLRVGCLV